MKLFQSTKTALRELADLAIKVARRKRKYKVLRIIPEGQSGAVGEWNGRKSFKKLGKRKFKQKLVGARAYQHRITRMG